MIASPGESCAINSEKWPCTVVPLEVILPVPTYSFNTSNDSSATAELLLPEDDPMSGASSLFLFADLSLFKKIVLSEVSE